MLNIYCVKEQINNCDDIFYVKNYI